MQAAGRHACSRTGGPQGPDDVRRRRSGVCIVVANYSPGEATALSPLFSALLRGTYYDGFYDSELSDPDLRYGSRIIFDAEVSVYVRLSYDWLWNSR